MWCVGSNAKPALNERNVKNNKVRRQANFVVWMADVTSNNGVPGQVRNVLTLCSTATFKQESQANLE
jgi:hypothetical protein